MQEVVPITAAVVSLPVALGLAWACLNGVLLAIAAAKR
jgi:hypothetical protein